MTNFQRVKNFHNIFGQVDPDTATWPSKEVIKLRIALIVEELNELKDAIKEKDMVEVADALTDILYVTYGAGATFGINLDECFAEVHRSNMSKLQPDGTVKRREDGKIQKGENYSSPNLKPIVYPED